MRQRGFRLDIRKNSLLEYSGTGTAFPRGDGVTIPGVVQEVSRSDDELWFSNFGVTVVTLDWTGWS